MAQKHVFNLTPNRPDGVERGARILKDHRHFAAAQILHLALARRAKINAGVDDGAVRDASRTVKNAHNGIGCDGFA